MVVWVIGVQLFGGGAGVVAAAAGVARWRASWGQVCGGLGGGGGLFPGGLFGYGVD